MLGLNLTKRNKNDIVYLANEPYVRSRFANENPVSTQPQYESIQQQFVADIIRWAVQKNLVQQTESELIPVVDKNIASLSYILHMHNFQHLVYTDKLDELLSMLSDNISFLHTTQLQQLTISLLGLHPPEFIHYHINRVYRAYSALPFVNADLTWGDIHEMYPFIWVILTIHLVLKSYTSGG